MSALKATAVECSMSGKEYLDQMLQSGFVVLERAAPSPEKKPRSSPKRKR